MSEIVIHLDADGNVAEIMKAISPYFQAASITVMPANWTAANFEKKASAPKIWDGNLDWLGKPWKTEEPFQPLTRAELYDR